MPHYSHGHEVDPDAERALRDWAFAHEDDPDPEAAEFAPLPRPGEHDLLRPVDDGSDHYDPGDELIREAMHPGRPLHADDYFARQNMEPQRPAR